MSHLQHINAFKMDLIEKGVTNPNAQIELARTAYIAAFIRFSASHNLSVSERKTVMEDMLGYWNETHPVNGPYVVVAVNQFFIKLYSMTTCIEKAFTLSIPAEEVEKHLPEYAELDSYKALVKTLLAEIEYKKSNRGL